MWAGGYIHVFSLSLLRIFHLFTAKERSTPAIAKFRLGELHKLGGGKILKIGVFWDVTPCGSCKNARFGGT
jgi:hypothetical protein